MGLETEFRIVFVEAWLATVLGLFIVMTWRRCWHGRMLGAFLLSLSPAVFSAYGFHSIQVYNQVLAQKGQKVDDRIFLTRLDTIRLRNGATITTEQFSDASVRRSLSSAAGRDGREPSGAGEHPERDRQPESSIDQMFVRRRRDEGTADFAVGAAEF